MRLKSIELNGFKTFATKTVFEFADEVTVIVGPNGSGKSNIADAVRWVLGEQSYKLLRGKKTLDLIFSGSEQRPRAGMASASIVFDNSEGWLPIDFSEVSITRRAYRDGKNEYFINGQQVLLRDVYELLGQSGLAERTYTIIGQGLVDAALSLKAEERRALFEEAAGIGLYRARKADAERRLEKTHYNLDRVEDILSELRPRLKSLERQAVRAEQYDQVKKDLKVLLQEWYGYHWARVQADLNAAKNLESKFKIELDKARSNQAALDRELSENQAGVQSQRSRLNTWHRELAEHHSQKENISRQRAVAEERIRSLEKRIQDLEAEGIRLEQQLEFAREKSDQSQDDARSSQESFELSKTKADQARADLENKLGRIRELETDAASAQEGLSRQLEGQIRLRSQLVDRQEQIQRKNNRLQEADDLISAARESYQKIHEGYAAQQKQLAEAAADRENLEAEMEKVRSKKASLEKNRLDRFDRLSRSKTESSQLAAELLVLQQSEDKLAGYAEGAKILLSESRTGKLGGILGTLNNFLEVPEEYEKPVAAALGDYLDAVLLESESDSENALEILLEGTVKGVLLPLNRLVALERLKVDRKISGFIGIAADLVKTSPRYQPVVDLLLGRVFIMKDRKDLTRILRDQPPGTKAVTLKGEVFYTTGEIVTGSQGQSGILSRSRQQKSWQEKITELGKKITVLEKDIEGLDGQLEEIVVKESNLKDRLAEARAREESVQERYNQAALERISAEKRIEWETAQHQKMVAEIEGDSQEIARIKEQLEKTQIEITKSQEKVAKTRVDLRELSIDEEREQLGHWETQVAVAERALLDAKQRVEERENARNEAKAEVESNRQLRESFQGQIKKLTEETAFLKDGENAIQQTIAELRTLIDETDASLSEDEKHQRDLQTQEANARRLLNQAERSYAQADINLTRNREKLETIQERIREDIGLVELEYKNDISGPTPLPLEGYVQKLPVVTEISKDLGNTIREQRAQLRRLGAVNPEAQEEYREVSHRHDFLTEQLSDLRKAESDLKEVIAELDVLMEREFRKTFNAVSAEFRDIFSQLFGGGKGQLMLSEPEDLTGSGVEIQVRLPGRRAQGLSLLSGGERSLIAAALIFSLLKISPTPFCVLDEVDAMLDESNVARFRKLLRELSSTTQFIVITHNRNTVQVADVIYGIIMSEDSSSQVLSLKLDEVDEVIET
jgi:chromosome segregation protein